MKNVNSLVDRLRAAVSVDIKPEVKLKAQHIAGLISPKDYSDAQHRLRKTKS